jgi:hypothetical protein
VTPLDALHAAHAADPEAEAPRLAWFGLLADTELFLPTEAEATGGQVTPRILALSDGPLLPAFDSEERLAAFSGAAVAYVALPGRVVAAQLAGQGVALGINLGVADSAMLLPPAAVDWLAATLASAPAPEAARPVAVRPPGDLAAPLAAALARALVRAGGWAATAHLVMAEHADGRRAPLLAFGGVAPGAAPALARAVAEALAFSGAAVDRVEVAFPADGDPLAAAIAAAGLALPVPPPPAPAPPAATRTGRRGCAENGVS